MELVKPPWAAAGRLMSPLVCALAATASWAAEPPAPPSLVPTSDGASVVDLDTKQIWPRCVEGMKWTGKTCTGDPVLMTQAEAIAWAAAVAKAEGLSWRLPRVTELRRLADKSTSRPGQKSVLFPAAPAGLHWSATASLDAAQVNQYNYGNIAQGRTNENVNRLALRHSWAVNLTTGEAKGDISKSTKLPVRLVRAPP